MRKLYKKYSDRLFYSKYKYSVQLLYIVDANIFRGVGNRLTETVLRKRLSNSSEDSYYWVPRSSRYTTDQLNEVMTLFNMLSNLKDVTISVRRHDITIYTNDYKKVTTDREKIITEVIINRPFKSIILKNSTFKYRIKFVYDNTVVKERDAIRNFLKNNSLTVSPNKILSRYTEWPTLGSFNFSLDYGTTVLTIDVQNEELVTFFSLISGKINYKIYTILNKPIAINTIKEGKQCQKQQH